MTDTRRAPGGSDAAGREPRRSTADARPARERVSGIQRQRLLAAMAELTAERGAGNVTVAHVVARSSVSRRTFYELFDDRDDCLLAALDQAIERATTAVLPAYEHPGRWRERIRNGLLALLAFLDEEPALARLITIESLGAGPQALKQRTRVIQALITAVDQGRTESRLGRKPPALAAEGAVGAVSAVIHARLTQDTHKPLSALAGELMGIIVLPYEGHAAAQRELDRPPPPQLEPRPTTRHDPLDGLDMRLTYRTVRVLVALAANQGANNRQIGDTAGIHDQGQISKLLTRLQNLGLAHNHAHDQPKGTSNAWTLTNKGHDIHEAIKTVVGDR